MESYDNYTTFKSESNIFEWLFLLCFFGFIVGFIFLLIKSYREDKILQEKIKSILNFSFEEKLDDYIQIGITGNSGGYNSQDILKHSFFLVFQESMLRFAVIEILDGALRANTMIEILRYKISENITMRQVSKTKTKGRLGRAVVGGVLFGGVGAVVGGLTGKSETKTETEVESITYTVHVDTNNDKIPHFGFTKYPQEAEKWTLRFEKALNNRKSKLGHSNLDGQHLGLNSIADEILKLKELQLKGIISETEFENQKQKLLNR